MTNCIMCVQSIEADPLNLTIYFNSLPDLHHNDISPAPHPTNLKQLTSLLLVHTKINISIPGSCDTTALYCSSISRQKQASSQMIFYPASLAENLIIIFIQTRATKKTNIKSILISLWPLEKPFFCID